MEGGGINVFYYSWNETQGTSGLTKGQSSCWEAPVVFMYVEPNAFQGPPQNSQVDGGASRVFIVVEMKHEAIQG